MKTNYYIYDDEFEEYTYGQDEEEHYQAGIEAKIVADEINNSLTN